MIRLETEVILGRRIQIACLPESSKIGYPTQFGQEVWAMGFGDKQFNGTDSENLLNVKLTHYDPKIYCKNVLKSFTKNWATQLCVGNISFNFKHFI